MIKNRDYKKGIVILAAGASTRLGRPKQLLNYKGQSLLKRIVSEALNSNAEFVLVVLGANYESHLSAIKDIEGIKILRNKNWKNGMGNSLKFSLNSAISIFPECQQLIFSVCDQPFLNFKIFNDLFDAFEKEGKPIIASKYVNNQFGIPALFNKTLFKELLSCDEDSGAKKIIKNNVINTAYISFSKGNIDIDTENDYNELLEK